MKHEGFKEVLPGLWYCEADGTPWSTKYLKNEEGCLGYTTFYDGSLRPLKSIDKYGYYRVRHEGKIHKWHRLVYEFYFGEIPKYKVIDHYDNNPKNNLIDNLRLVTLEKNNQKRKKNKNNTSGFPGVFLNKKTNKYFSAICVNCKRVSLGTFDTPTEAHKAYLAGKIKYHGQDSINPLQNEVSSCP